MAAAAATQQAEWIGIRLASEIAGIPAYSLQKYGLAKMIRTRLVAPFKILYNRADVDAVALSLAVPPVPSD